MPDKNEPPEEFRLSCRRVRKKFSPQERREYSIEAFKYILHFFKNAFKEMQENNSAIEAELTAKETYAFEAVVYEDGALVSECRIWLFKGGMGAGDNEIRYSSKPNANTFNESIVIEDDGYAMYLRPTLMQLGANRGDLFRMDGAADHLWTIFKGPLE